jgi:branched-chain amino acid transport system ATP-binding protein
MSATEAIANRSEVLIRCEALTRQWGGLIAVNQVSLDFCLGAVHAVIGTNGAGKSTLINMLSGEIAPSSGSIYLGSENITAWSQPRRAQAGLGRSYQRNTIFPSFSVLENCRLAAQARIPKPWHWWQSASSCPQSLAAAREAAQLAGLHDWLDQTAGLLSHGQKRQLEIAMCLAGDPKVLLLDEPLAGMGAEETDRMLTLLEKLRQNHAILLVEHDMDAVFRIADQITVMVNGSVIASGTPEEVRNNAEVQAAYLGGH